MPHRRTTPKHGILSAPATKSLRESLSKEVSGFLKVGRTNSIDGNLMEQGSSPWKKENAPSEYSAEDLAVYDSFPLAQSLLRHARKRDVAFELEGKHQIFYPKSNEGWIATLFMIRGRALDLMVFPWTISVIHAIIYALITEIALDPEYRSMESWEIFFGFVLNSTLSFLLVFRLNRAAGRFWTARTLWGVILVKSRSMAGGLIAHATHDEVERDMAIRWLLAFCFATMHMLRGNEVYPEDQLAGILVKDEIEAMKGNGHPPLFVGEKIRRHLERIFRVDADTPLPLAHARVRHLDSLESQLNLMLDACGGLERIQKTPLPVVYVSHLRTFLMIALFMFPYVWGPSWRWRTIPIVAITAFAWLGIEAASAEVECPFKEERVNALNMDGFCMTIIDNIKQHLVNHADDCLAEKRQNQENSAVNTGNEM